MAGCEPDRGPGSVGPRRILGAVATISFLAVVVCYATLIEPYRVLLERVEIRLPALPPDLDGLRLLQISDLESRGSGLRERQVRAIADRAGADLIVITGDLVAKSLRGERREEAAREVAAFLGGLPSRLGTWFVEGHGERMGIAGREVLLEAMERAGASYLEDDVAIVPVGDAMLALVGLRIHSRPRPVLFRIEPSGGVVQRGLALPAAHLLLDAPGLPDSFEITGELRFTREDSGIGITFNNRLGEDEDLFYRLRRTEAGPTIHLSPHGAVFTRGRTAGRRAPLPGPWHAFRVRADRGEEETRVRGRIWPSDGTEPGEWEIDCVEPSETALSGGAFGLWTSGPGTKAFRNLRIVSDAGEAILDGGRRPDGERVRWIRTRAPDYILALEAKIPEGAYPVAISHSPDLFVHTAALGWPLLLSGHTQGGQICLPLVGALTTDTWLGRKYAAGLFREGDSQLYINRGVGTSRIPVRFLAPPEVTLITLRPTGAPASAASGSS